jgi:Zn-dependent membrane protease YugP
VGLALLVVVAAAALSVWAQGAVSRQLRRWRQVPARSGLSGAEVARALLAAEGLAGTVQVERLEGSGRDHYDPRARVLRLSPEVHDGRDLAASGVAAHEAGHALQQALGHQGLRLRSLAVPVAMLGNAVGLPLLVLGLALRNLPLAAIGLVLYAGVVLLQVLSLPVEIDASRRALGSLSQARLLETREEADGVRDVLNAAALTYVAAALSGIGLLLWGALLLGRRN